MQLVAAEEQEGSLPFGSANGFHWFHVDLSELLLKLHARPALTNIHKGKGECAPKSWAFRLPSMTTLDLALRWHENAAVKAPSG